ncbi:MAG: hypothetical protein LBH69_03570 [Methanomassiliicoccaceae archaeon]|jgi:hypothetical protein|nr:hypothetical protein [Methanomassiliicoccaceae archaeon]
MAYSASMEAVFKRYLIMCEYMQIDPCNVYDTEYIEKRAEEMLSQWNDGDGPEIVKELRDETKWFVKDYGKLAGKGFLKRDFAYRCSLFIQKKYLRIHPGTISKDYHKKELKHQNYDAYAALIYASRK